MKDLLNEHTATPPSKAGTVKDLPFPSLSVSVAELFQFPSPIIKTTLSLLASTALTVPGRLAASPAHR